LNEAEKRARCLEGALEAEQERGAATEERLVEVKQSAARSKSQQQEEVSRLERECSELQKQGQIQAQKLKNRVADAEEETEQALAALQMVNAKIKILEEQMQTLPELEKTAELHIKMADLNMRKKLMDRENEARNVQESLERTLREKERRLELEMREKDKEVDRLAKMVLEDRTEPSKNALLRKENKNLFAELDVVKGELADESAKVGRSQTALRRENEEVGALRGRLQSQHQDLNLLESQVRRTAGVPSRNPYDNVRAADLLRVFQSEACTQEGNLSRTGFQRMMDKLGLDGETLGRRLFDAFDRGGHGELDFRETFLGMSLLLSGSYEERLECAFMMISVDADGSGKVSKDELDAFLRCLAPATVKWYAVRALAADIMAEASGKTGWLTVRQFMGWEGKRAILEWIQQYHTQILTRVMSDMGTPVSRRSPSRRGTALELSQTAASPVPFRSDGSLRRPTPPRSTHGTRDETMLDSAGIPSPGPSPLREQAMATMAQLEELEENISSTRNKWKRKQIKSLAGLK
jgi:hypothetical protein